MTRIELSRPLKWYERSGFEYIISHLNSPSEEIQGYLQGKSTLLVKRPILFPRRLYINDKEKKRIGKIVTKKSKSHV